MILERKINNVVWDSTEKGWRVLLTPEDPDLELSFLLPKKDSASKSLEEGAERIRKNATYIKFAKRLKANTEGMFATIRQTLQREGGYLPQIAGGITSGAFVSLSGLLNYFRLAATSAACLKELSAYTPDTVSNTMEQVYNSTLSAYSSLIGNNTAIDVNSSLLQNMFNSAVNQTMQLARDISNEELELASAKKDDADTYNQRMLIAIAVTATIAAAVAVGTVFSIFYTTSRERKQKQLFDLMQKFSQRSPAILKEIEAKERVIARLIALIKFDDPNFSPEIPVSKHDKDSLGPQLRSRALRRADSTNSISLGTTLQRTYSEDSIAIDMSVKGKAEVVNLADLFKTTLDSKNDFSYYENVDKTLKLLEGTLDNEEDKEIKNIILGLFKAKIIDKYKDAVNESVIKDLLAATTVAELLQRAGSIQTDSTDMSVVEFIANELTEVLADKDYLRAVNAILNAIIALDPEFRNIASESTKFNDMILLIYEELVENFVATNLPHKLTEIADRFAKLNETQLGSFIKTMKSLFTSENVSKDQIQLLINNIDHIDKLKNAVGISSKKMLRNEKEKVLIELSDRLIKLNAAGNDTTLAKHGEDPTYLYSFSDGFRLLMDIRRNSLNYEKSIEVEALPAKKPEKSSETSGASESITETPVVEIQKKEESPTDSSTSIQKVVESVPYKFKEGEEYSCHRENADRIFIADPYFTETFAESLTDDIKILTGEHHDVKDKQKWDMMPTTIVLPVLSTNHWRTVHIQIDYDKKTCSILWDDPYGKSHFYPSLQENLLKAIELNVVSLFKAQGIDIKSTNEIRFEKITKIIDQQPASNGRDCGPINFSNISDYVSKSKREMPNGNFAKSISEVSGYYTVPVSYDREYSNQIKKLRGEHAKICEAITETPGLSSEKVGQKVIELWDTKLKNLSENEELRKLMDEISKMDPIWVSKAFELLEKAQYSGKQADSSSLNSPYTLEQIKAVHSIIKGEMSKKELEEPELDKSPSKESLSVITPKIV